jgi:hypothetical protein
MQGASVSRLPNTDQLGQWLEAILQLRNKTGPKGQQVYDAEILVKRIQRAAERSKAGSPIPDGHRRGSGVFGGGGGGLKIIVDDESVDVTGVEWAMFGRLDPPPDRFADAYREMILNLRQVVNGLDLIRGQLDRMDKVRAAAPESDDVGCEAMGQIGSWEPVEHRTQIDGRFYDLGGWAYKFSRRTGRLPSAEECRLHQQGKHVRVKIDGQSVIAG